jgi:hypothetical protein
VYRGGVAFYISGHGFGHASRQIEIINALADRLDGGGSILVRTTAARWLFDRTLRTSVTLLHGVCDTGVVQVDSLRLDEAATASAARDFYATFGERVAEEASFLREHDVRLVVADAPPLACAAAAAAGVPSIVISNFTWDWIYERYRDEFDNGAPGVLDIIRDAYAQASEGWRLPLGGGFETFRSVRDLPLVARHATKGRHEVLDALALPSARPLVLLSFGGYGIDGLDLRALDCLDEWTAIVTGRTAPSALPEGVAFVNERRIYESGMRYEDLVAAVHVVATKPGYGIISECVASGTAILYTSRGRFAEYDVMVREMPRILRCAYIDQATLLAGCWKAALTTLSAAPPPPERPATNGAEIAAQRIAALI